MAHGKLGVVKAVKLGELRDFCKKLRGFLPENYIKRKTQAINDFFRRNQLDSCVIGISGGIDSAVTLGLLIRAAEDSTSPLRAVWPLLMPIFGHGTSGQDEATRLGKAQCETFKIKHKLVDLSGVYQAYLSTSGLTDTSDDAWCNGQLASILRTPCSYHHAAILQTQGYRSIVVGTTNRDEGSYVGFYGKASDAMVDLQPIADIHKSEVYTIATLLGVIPEIAGRTARGDVWNNKTSEEMMGAPYWFLEMYLIILEYGSDFLIGMINKLSSEDRTLYDHYRDKIEEVHQKNAHKYQVGLPSHFIDCMSREVPGGW